MQNFRGQNLQKKTNWPHQQTNGHRGGVTKILARSNFMTIITDLQACDQNAHPGQLHRSNWGISLTF
jgi:hypothetical protein